MKTLSRVLLAVCDTESVALLRKPLQGAGIRAIHLRDGDSVLEFLPSSSCEAIFLDLDLPPFSGWPILKIVRGHSALYRLPVLAQGRGRQAQECEKALRAGADDYIRPPVSSTEIALRLQRLVRMNHPPDPPAEVLRMGPLAVDVKARRVFLEDREIELPGREWELLVHLLRHRNRAVSHKEFFREIWKNEHYEGSTLYTHMKRLRRRLGSFGGRIRTLRGYGYRLDDDLFDTKIPPLEPPQGKT